MEQKMFCYQCEQTAGCTGCTGSRGVCGKTAQTAQLQDELTGAFRLIDDSGEDYLYSPTEPGPVCDPSIKGKFEVIEDDEQGTLDKAINK